MRHIAFYVLAFEADELPSTVFKIRPEQQSFWWHFDPQRIAVPRYQFFFRVGLWILFLVCYTLAIQTPDRGFGPEDIILYTHLLGYLVEDLVKVRLSCLCFRCKREAAGLTPVSPPCRSTRSVSTRPFRCGRSSTGSFTHSPRSLSCAFILSCSSLSGLCEAVAHLLNYAFSRFRCFDLGTHDEEKQNHYRQLAFRKLSRLHAAPRFIDPSLSTEWLSMAAPLVWAKLLTVFDLFRFFGVMQIVVWRMLKVGQSAYVCGVDGGRLTSAVSAGIGRLLRPARDFCDRVRTSLDWPRRRG